MDYDVLFIGSGHAAWNGAIPMQQHGLKVAVVEEGLFGGTCTNRGCNAKITLDWPVTLVHQIKQLQGRGFTEVPKINWHDLMIHKHEVIDHLATGNQLKLTNAGVTTYEGHAVLQDAHTVRISGGHSGSVTVTAEKIVLALGLVPNIIDIPGSELFHDSTDFLVLPELPQKIVFIGAGYIAMEFAMIAQAAGADVTIISHGHQPLRDFYQPYVQRLVSAMKRDGIKFNFDVNLTKAEKSQQQVTLFGENGYQIEADYVVDATGRKPNTADMGLEDVGVVFDETGVAVNGHLQTNIDSIYAAGDVIQKPYPKITPTAIFESQYLSQLFTGATSQDIDYPAVAYTVFTSPRIAQVGVNPNLAAAKPDEYQLQHFAYNEDWFRQVQNEQEGGLTLIFDQNDRFVGATAISNDAVEEINGLLDILVSGMTRAEVQRLIYIFPSIEHGNFRKLS